VLHALHSLIWFLFLQVRETVRDVAFLHNEQMYAVAQKSKFLNLLELCGMLLLLRVSEIRPWLNLLMNQSIKLFKILHFLKEISGVILSHANNICDQ